MSEMDLSQEDKHHAGSINRAFVGFIAARPWVSIGIGLLIFAALMAGMGKVRADFTHTGFFWDSDPKLKTFEAFERKFGNDDAVVIAVHSPSGIFDVESATLLKKLTAKMWQVPEIIRVDSLSNFNWVHASGDDIAVEPLLPETLTPELLAERRQIALAHETLPGYLVSKDGNTAVLFARVKPGIDHAPDAPGIIKATREAVASVQGGDNKLYVLGGPAMTNAFQEISQSDTLKLLPLVVGLAALFLVALLRSVGASVLPFVVVILATLGAFGLAGHLGLTQTVMSTVVPSILIAVGIADTVHILVSYVTALRKGAPRKQAAHHALTRNFLATFLTCITTAVGFFSFVTADLKPIATLGVMSGAGTLFAWIFVQLVVGGLLFILPIKVKPFPPERFARTERRAHNLVDAIGRNRWPIIGATVVLSAASLWYAVGVEVNSDPIQYFKKGAEIRTASEFLEDNVGSARSLEFVLNAGSPEGAKDPEFLRKVDAFRAWVESQPGATRATSIVDVLKSMHKSLDGDRPESYQLADTREGIAQELLLYSMGLPQGMDVNDRITVNNDAIRLTLLNHIKTSRDTVALVRRAENKGKEMGLSVQATGKFYLYQQTNEYVVDSFLNSLWSSIIVIGLIMGFFLRSWKLGLISMIPNIVPLFAGGVLLRLIGQPLDMGTVLVASVCLGISIDDTSHVLANYASLRRLGVAPNQAMREVMAHSGPALLSTNAILITSFAAFATATFMPNVYFGILTAFTLAVALIADVFFTPALLMLTPVKDAAPAQTGLSAATNAVDPA